MRAFLSSNSKYSVFQLGDLKIKFKTSPYLERYISIKKWHDGYIECMAKYSTLDAPIEEYIDLRFIAQRLRLPSDIFKTVKEVTVR